MAVLNITDQNVEQVLKEKKLVLVDFWSPFCAPCRLVAPVLEELDQEIGDQIQLTKMNVDENPQFATSLRIMAVPTFVIFQKGKLVDQIRGFRSKGDLVKIINRYID